MLSFKKKNTSRWVEIIGYFPFRKYPKCSGREWWNHYQSFIRRSDLLHSVRTPTVSSSLNDVCCSDNALMWEIAVLCSMWQIIRHANQQAAVESLITVRFPPQRHFSAPYRPHHHLPSPPDCSSLLPPTTPSPSAPLPPFLLLPLHP